MNALSESPLDAAWRALTRLRTLAGIAFVVLALLVAEAVDPAAPLTGAQRFIAVLGLGGVLAVAHTLAYAANKLQPQLIETLQRLGLVERHPLPFFDDELLDEATAWTRAQARRAQRTLFAVALLIVVSLGGAFGLVLAHALTLDHGGYLTLTQGNTSTAYSADGPDGAERVFLGYQARLDGLEVSDDGSGWLAVVNADDVRTGDTGVARLAQGHAERVGGRWLTLHEVRPTSGIRAVTLNMTRRDDGLEVRHTLRPGQRVVLDGDDAIRLADTSGGDPRMGTSVQIEEFRGDDLVRTEWIFADAPSFDDRHGSGNWSAAVAATQPDLTAVFAVRPLGHVYWAWASWGLLALALLALAALWSSAVLRVGVSGDYELIVIRGLRDRADADDIYRHLVPADALAAWRKGGA